MEPECFLEDTLRMRQSAIPHYTDLGPPDMCYLIVEQQKKAKLLQKKAPQPYFLGLYHYVYGVDTSSSACVAAYVTDCINSHTNTLGGVQPEQFNQSSTGVK